MDGSTAQARRYYHHVANGGTLNERDVARMVEAMETKDAEIARLTAALAEAEARGYARAMEDAAIICEALNDKRLSGASGDFIASLASQRIRALAKKEAGAVFPPPHCTAWEDCNHDGICHDPKCCGATGPNHEAFYGEAGE